MLKEQTRKKQAVIQKYVDVAVVNLPDLHFSRWCNEQFSINRGVYNIIDERLYEAGFQKIQERRIELIHFLQNVIQQSEQQRYFKFGPGNLTKALQQFYGNRVGGN